MINPFRPYLELKRSIVNLKTGSSFRGVVYRQRGKFLILKNSEILSDRGQRMDAKSIDGELFINLEDIDFVQVL